MKRLSTFLAVSALLAGPAMAQTVGVGGDAGQSSNSIRQSSESQQRTLQNDRSAGTRISVNAATIILPALAKMGDTKVIGGDETALRTACAVATGNQALVQQIHDNLEEARNVSNAVLKVANPGDANSYEIGWTLTWKVDRATEAAGSYVVSKVVDPGSLDVLKDGKHYTLVLAQHAPPDEVIGRGRTAEQDAKVDAFEAAMTPEQGMQECMGALTRMFVTGSQVGWPAADEKAEFAVARMMTVANLAVMTMARDVAARIQTGLYRDEEEAQAAALAAVTPAVLEHGFKLYSTRVVHLDDIPVALDLTGNCGMGWTATVDGQAYDFCGERHGFKIEVAGGQWAGDGWLAGAKVDVSFGEAATASMAQSAGTTTHQNDTWQQSVKSFLGFGQ